MKNFMKLFAGIGLLFLSMIIANAQTTARGLYVGYTANTAKPPKPTVKPPKKPSKPGKQNQGRQKPPTVVANNIGATPMSTGLPGTKITIELSRSGKLSFVKPTYKFRSGDKIRLRLQTNFTGYISLLNVGSTGEVRFLYPYDGANNQISASSDVPIPGSGDWIVFDDKTGTENLTIIMSKKPLDKSNDDYKDLRQSNSRDLLIEYADDAVYAVCEENKITKPVGFSLKLNHGK